MKNTSLLTKLILFGCLLTMVPVVVTGTFSYMQSSRQVQEQKSGDEMQYIEQMRASVEGVLVSANHTLDHLIDSTLMDEVLGRPLTATDFRLYRNFRQELSHLTSMEGVENVIMVNRRQNWLVKNSGLYRLDEHADGDTYTSYFDDLPHHTSWVLLKHEDFQDSISSVSCPYSVSLVKKMPPRIIDKYGLAFLTMPSCELAQMLKHDPDGKTVMIVDQNNRVLVHQKQEYIGRPLNEIGFKGDMSFAGASGQFQTGFGNERYHVTYSVSPLNQWIYLSAVSIDQLTRDSRNIFWFMFYVCVSLILLSFGFVWLATYRYFSPLDRLVKMIAGSPERRVQIRNELQMIEDQFKTMFSTQSKLQKDLREHSRQSRSLMLARMFKGLMKLKEIHQQLKHHGLKPVFDHWNQMGVLVMEIDTLEHSRFETRDLGLLYFAISNIAEELVPEEHRLPAAEVDDTLVMLTGVRENDPERWKAFIREVAEKLRDQVRNYLSLSVSIGISLPFSEAENIHEGYRQGREALKVRIKQGKGVIAQYSSVHPHKHEIMLEYPHLTEMELTEAIQLGDREKALEQLGVWFRKALKSTPSHRDYQVSMMRLLNRLLTVKQEHDISFGQIGVHDASLYEELLSLKMPDEMEDWFAGRLVLPMVGVFRDRRESKYGHLSEKIIDLIHKHYDTDISLEDCASRLHYKANYLSVVFKKETGYTFSEYLTLYRCKLARQWLTETGMTVREIAEKLGYTNSQNFIRVFKKQEGMTPGQYREKYADRQA